MKKEFFIEKRMQVTEYMKDDSMLVMFSGTAPHKTADAMHHYIPNRSFFYLTGLDKPNLILLISKLKGEVKEYLFVEKGDPMLEKWEGKKLDADTAKSLSGISDIQFVNDFHNSLNGMLYRSDFKNAYLNLEQLRWNMASDAAHDFAEELKKRHPYIKIKNIFHYISELRTIKSSDEVEHMKKAIELTGEGIAAMMKNAKPGMVEYQLQAHLDYVFTNAGEREHAFGAIIASGINGATLHYEDNNCVIEDNSLVLTDVGAQSEYYCADITRTFPANGRFTERQKEIYNIVLDALNDTIAAIKPGVPFAELNIVTKKSLTEGCKRIGLIQDDSELSKYYYHGVSHFLGLDTHDVGGRDVTLRSGMVLTVEPGLYIEAEKLGIRLEDDVLVTDTGNENLSKNLIKTVEEIEAFMSR